MAIKSEVIIEIVKNDRVYQFHMPVGAPFGECYDACFEALGQVIEMAKNAADQAKPKEIDDKLEKVEGEIN